MLTLKFIRLVLIVAIALLISRSSYGQNNFNLDLGSIKGESTLALHPNTIDCNSFSLNATNSGAGIVFGDLAITKTLDKASPQLFLASAQATNLPSATLYLSKGGSYPVVDYYVIKLTNAKVSSVSQNASPGVALNETITFRYQRIEIDYYPISPQGQQGTPVVMKWDLTTNSPF